MSRLRGGRPLLPRSVGVLGALVLPAVLVLAGGCKRKAAPTPAGGHAEPHDDRVAPMTAAFEAKEGATQCESAWNALVALDQASVKAGMPPPWEKLPARATFEETCNRLSAEQQWCFVPKHQADHKRCDPVLAQLTTDPWGIELRKLLKPPAGSPVGSGVVPRPSSS